MYIHLFCKAGPEYERPWATKAGGENPLAAWAEKKKEEMEEEVLAHISDHESRSPLLSGHESR